MTSLEIEHALSEVFTALQASSTADDFKAIGLRCREFLISLARGAFDPAKHGQADEPLPGPSDSKRMLDSYMRAELGGGSHEDARRFARAAVQLADAVTHKHAANRLDAALAVTATECVAKLVALISGEQIESQSIPWRGVEADGRYFAWDGPNLHALDDRPPVPAPDRGIEELRKAGMVPSFGTRRDLFRSLSQGRMQVFETDRRSWRRALLHVGEDQVLLVRPIRPGETP